MFADTLEMHRAFWKREETDRPLLGINVGFMANQRFPLLMESIPEGLVKPEDIHVDLFLKDCDRLYEIHQGMGDYPYVGAPFAGLPWLEAIMGCPVKSSPTNLWAEPCVDDWKNRPGQRPVLGENLWAQKLLELMRALVEHSNGKFPVASTLMRGPSDILFAMRGASQMPLDMIDEPDLIKRAAGICTDVWIEVGQAQLALIPESDKGYMAGDAALRAWTPDKLVWCQEDAMTLLSPPLYCDFFLPLDKRIAAGFPCSVFHLHGSALWAIDELVQIPELDIIELNLEDALCDVEGTFAGWKKIQAHKPLIIWRMYKDDFRDWLGRVLKELPSKGLSIQVSTNNEEEAGKVKEEFFEAVDKR